ncbi:hypothetical protein NQ036_08695 [Brevibacterium sp. 91QC2O2]|uniref:YqeB family protein n=1 Tax=Brevibacterium sp. 91QC2O2 TaxID=2968458 RepID=UPI00211BD54C|nr:hypothetical protein [Brevibacterium sp. 91QC2O2]MCQ9368314.1 hypothetical protein [Brevibacterium sp. 91QC2O2]
MTAPIPTSTVAIPTGYRPAFIVGGGLIGLLAAFVVGPLVSWLVGRIGDAPGMLRLAAELPLAWALPVLTIVGAIGGFLIVGKWMDEAGAIEVSARGITVHTEDADRFIAAEDISGLARTGHKELLVLGTGGRELLRSRLEAEMVPGLVAALDAHGLPGLAPADPHEADFTTWVDGAGLVEGDLEELLRSRRRALADKRGGAAEDALEALRDRGVMVRDRDGRQQIRMIGRQG